MTTNLIAVGYTPELEFSFVIKPSPDSKQSELTGFQFLQQTKEMIFVSNKHVLVRFESGKIVIFEPNGTIVNQDEKVQKVLDQVTVIEGSSFVVNEKMCLVVCLRNQDLVTLEFNKNGRAQIVARF